MNYANWAECGVAAMIRTATSAPALSATWGLAAISVAIFTGPAGLVFAMLYSALLLIAAAFARHDKRKPGGGA